MDRVSSLMPSVVSSCSSDGTVRLFDTRLHYPDSDTQRLVQHPGTVNYEVRQHLVGEDDIIPQALGGGLIGVRPPPNGAHAKSLLLDYSLAPDAPAPTAVGGVDATSRGPERRVMTYGPFRAFMSAHLFKLKCHTACMICASASWSAFFLQFRLWDQFRRGGDGDLQTRSYR